MEFLNYVNGENIGWQAQNFLLEDFRKQTNGWDCGVYLCLFIKCLCAGVQFNFSQSEMGVWRERIVEAILNVHNVSYINKCFIESTPYN